MLCVFCEDQNIKIRIVGENERAIAFLTNIPIVSGHTLIIPRRHVKYYEEVTSDEKESIETLRMHVKSALQKTFSAEGFNYAWNEEPIDGQSVPHFHLHMIPRKEGDEGVHEYEPRKFLYRPGSRAVSPDEELKTTAEEIRKNI